MECNFCKSKCQKAGQPTRSFYNQPSGYPAILNVSKLKKWWRKIEMKLNLRARESKENKGLTIQKPFCNLLFWLVILPRFYIPYIFLHSYRCKDAEHKSHRVKPFFTFCQFCIPETDRKQYNG